MWVGGKNLDADPPHRISLFTGEKGSDIRYAVRMTSQRVRGPRGEGGENKRPWFQEGEGSNLMKVPGWLQKRGEVLSRYGRGETTNP